MIQADPLTRRRQRADRLGRGLLAACAWVGPFLLLLLLGTLYSEADFSKIPVPLRVPLGQTALALGAALLLAAPAGLALAAWRAWGRPGPLRDLVQGGVALISAFPTVGLLFLGMFVIFPLLEWLPESRSVQVLCVLLLALVMAARVAEEGALALRQLPSGLLDGALALGTGRAEAALRVGLPAAWSGLVAACLLALSRGTGEAILTLMWSVPVVLDLGYPVSPLASYALSFSEPGSELRAGLALALVLMLCVLPLQGLAHGLLRRRRA